MHLFHVSREEPNSLGYNLIEVYQSHTSIAWKDLFFYFDANFTSLEDPCQTRTQATLNDSNMKLINKYITNTKTF